MRTTTTIEPEIAKKLKSLAYKERRSFKEVLNETLRRGLAAGTKAEPAVRFEVEPHSGGFRPGVDQAKLNQLADQLEAEDFAGEAST